MASLVQNAMYLGGSMVVFGLLFLPILFLLAVSALYIVMEVIQHFKERRGFS